MHGAALTHLIWAKPDAVVVELFAHRMSGLWYYEKYGDRADQSLEKSRLSRRRLHGISTSGLRRRRDPSLRKSSTE